MSAFFNIVLPKANIKNAYWNAKDAALVGKAFGVCDNERIKGFYRDLLKTCEYMDKLRCYPRVGADETTDEEGNRTYYDYANRKLWEAGLRIKENIRKEDHLCPCGSFVCNVDFDLVPDATCRKWGAYVLGDNKAFHCKKLHRKIRRSQEELDEENPFGRVVHPPRVAGPPTAPGILQEEEPNRKREREEDEEPVTQPPVKKNTIKVPPVGEGFVIRVDTYGIGNNMEEDFRNGTFVISRMDDQKEWKPVTKVHEFEEMIEALEKKIIEVNSDYPFIGEDKKGRYKIDMSMLLEDQDSD